MRKYPSKSEIAKYKWLRKWFGVTLAAALCGFYYAELDKHEND